MEKSKAQYILAGILIVLGVSGIMNQLFGWSLFRHIDLGGLFLLLPGLWFEYSYFSNHRSPKLLVPGGILTTLGILCLVESNTLPFIEDYIDSFYIMAPAVGLFQLYIHDKQDKGLLIPVVILTVIAVMDFLSEIMDNVFYFMDSSIIWPIVLVLIGVALLIGKKNSDGTDEKEKL